MQKKARTILCVDDSLDTLHTIEILLTRRGYRVVTARTGEAAIRLFRKRRCAVAIVDYMMPGMNGGKLAQQLRRLDAKLPIILHTGYSEIEDPLLSNVDCTVPKGSFASLLARLNEFLDRRERTPLTTPRARRKAAA